MESTSLDETVGCATKWVILTQSMQNLEFVYLKCVTYSQPIHLPLRAGSVNFRPMILYFTSPVITQKMFFVGFCNYLNLSWGFSGKKSMTDPVIFTTLLIFICGCTGIKFFKFYFNNAKCIYVLQWAKCYLFKNCFFFCFCFLNFRVKILWLKMKIAIFSWHFETVNNGKCNFILFTALLAVYEYFINVLSFIEKVPSGK